MQDGVKAERAGEDLAPETRETPRAGGPLQRWLVEHRDGVVRAALLTVVAVFVSTGIGLWVAGAFRLESVGYPAVWFLSFIGAASIFVPVPGLAAVCVAATPAFGLNPLAIGVLAGSAEALGEMTGYMAGLSGKSVVQRHWLYERVHGLLLRRGGLILFLLSVVPNPLFDIVGIAAGTISYPIRKFLFYVFVAKSIKSTGIAYACMLGVEWIQRYLG